MYCIYPHRNIRDYKANTDTNHICNSECPKRKENLGRMYWGWKWVPDERCAYLRKKPPYPVKGEKRIKLMNCDRRCPVCGAGMKRTYVEVPMFKLGFRTAKKVKIRKHRPVGYVCMGCGETVITKEFNVVQQLYGLKSDES